MDLISAVGVSPTGCYHVAHYNTANDGNASTILPGMYMINKPNADNELPPLSPPVFYILLAVGDQPRHGYAIMQEVERRTGGKTRLLPGSLYSTIKRMVSSSLIEECAGPEAADSDDERRRYYGITQLGREAAATEAERMQTLVQLARDKRLTTTA